MSIDLSGCRLAHYTIQARIGSGGMGEVYRARDEKLERDVAIKVLQADLIVDPAARLRFEREARLLAALNHPYICTVHDAGDADGIPYIVMELIEGETLADRIARGPLPLGDALTYASQLLEALEAAHAKGMIHRDVKPANIFLMRGGRSKLMDLGLARLAKEDPAASFAETGGGVTRTGSAVGTAAYMSPEQARGEELDARTDLFSFGGVLFEMVTGAPAFRGPTLASTFDAVLHQDPPPVSRLNGALPADLDQVIGRALSKDRNRRFQTSGEFRADVERIANGSAIAGTAIRGTKSRRWLVPAAGIAVAAVAIGAVLMGGRGSHPQAGIHSIAVLPLANESGPGDEYFTDGMTDELIGALAKVKGWRIISRTSVMSYKNTAKSIPAIAQELAVDAVVEGRVQHAGDKVRISAKLVRADRAEETLWSGSFDKDVHDVLELESQVARAIAQQISVTLTPQEQQRLAVRRAIEPAVFQLYLKGREAAAAGTEAALVDAIGSFEQVVARDPSYAPAEAQMALAYSSLNPDYRSPKEAMPKAREHAQRAIALDESVAEAHAALANVMLRFDWDWAGADREVRRAIELDPNSSDAHALYGNYLLAVGRNDAAFDELDLSHQLDPTSVPMYANFLGGLVTGRSYDRAIAECKKALAAGDSFAYAHGWLGMAYLMKGQTKEAIDELERAHALDPSVTLTHFLAFAQATVGHTAEARKLVSQLEQTAAARYTCAYEVASVHVGLGDNESAMRWLERGVAEQCDCMIWLKSEQWMDPLRQDPRYLELLKRVAFPKI